MDGRTEDQRASTRSERGSSRSAKAARRQVGGTEIVPGRGVHFRVWAPFRERVDLVLERQQRSVSLAREGDGYWSVLVEDLAPGALYRFRLDDDQTLYPDPMSRFQPEGPHGPSEVIDPAAYPWRDASWQGITLEGQVIYELHPGTFSETGTWNGACAQLPHLRELGVTVLELMPVAEFPGAFGWGYDGVDLFAPYHLYGRPDDFRRFVDDAHSLGIGVILDVVYNHCGPDGNYLRGFSPAYFSGRATEWGEAFNYDGEHAREVRTFVCQNAAYWIDEFHLDGLRLDATQSMFDSSPEHIATAVGSAARAAALDRQIILVAENEPQDTRIVRPLSSGGCGFDALWNDDLHHSAIVAMTGRNEAYYSDHLGMPQELVSAVKYGYLYQGQRYEWQKQRRGTSTRGLAPESFVAFLENHDQIANSSAGQRLVALTSPGRQRAMTALLLLSPWTPMLFQGQEWGSTRPFMYFADHHRELASLVRKGRSEFLRQFPSCAAPDMHDQLADPAAQSTFEQCRLNWSELELDRRAHQTLALHRDLLTLRRTDPVFARQGKPPVSIDGAVLGAECFTLRFFGSDDDDRLLIVNLGRDLCLVPAPEPLLAPPERADWQLVWASEDERYGGRGAPLPDVLRRGFQIAGHAAVVFGPKHGARS